MKRTIEINDTLQERVDGACEEVQQLLLDFLKENEPDELPCLNNDLDYSGSVHEIIDGSVPLYTSEIRDTWYLYQDELETAYSDAGVGNNPLENDGMTAIYFYISEQVNEWYNENAEKLFETWQETQELETEPA